MLRKPVFPATLLVLLVLGLSFLGGTPVVGSQVAVSAAAANHESGPLFVPGQLIVRFRPGVTEQQITALYRAQSLSQLDDLDIASRAGRPKERLVAVPPTRTLEFIRVLERNPIVAFAEPNFIRSKELLPNDPRFGEMWGLHNTGQTVGGVTGTADADIDAPEAWNITTGSSAVIVGVIDTGVNYTHEDLAANMWTNPGEIPGNGLDDDGNGFVDDIHGINAILNTGDPNDDNGHGTHVAGTLGAVGNNGIGVTGVNWTVRIAACKFLSAGGSGTTADAIKCFKYFNHLKNVLGQNILVTNNSWGGGGFSQVLKDAMAGLDQPGMTPILHAAAAGNNSANNDTSPQFPASYDLDNIIAVAATDQTDHYASFTNFGPTSVDLAAPGVNILSTVPTGTCQLCDSTGYTLLNGTSMATPHVTGAAALLWANAPTLTFSQVKARLMFNADPLADLTRQTVTNTRLNVLNALSVNDTIPPAAVTNLAVSGSGLSTVTLTWRATGDDGLTGTASAYDLRYSTTAITDANWDAATRAGGEPQPQPAGSTETFTVSGLVPGTTYFFALKVIDNAGNQSSLSNSAQGSTLAGVVVFQDNMENGVGGWTVTGTAPLWHQSTHRSNSPTTAWYFGQEGTFNLNTGIDNFGRLKSPAINLTAATEAVLVFHEWNQMSSEMDARVLAQTPNGQQCPGPLRPGCDFPDVVFVSADTGGAWVRRQVDISFYTGQPGDAFVFFDFQNCGSFAPCNQNFEGWYIDDVQVIARLPNDPTITSTPVTTGIVGQPYSYQAVASGTEPITWSLVTGPAGMTIDAGTGLVSWTPTASGSFPVQIQASNAVGADAQSYTITVSNPDTVNITRAEYTVSKQKLRVEATSTNASATLQLFVTATNELIGTLTNNGGGKYGGQFTWPVNPQNITVKSSSGGSDSANVTLK
ncbi:MAG: S8 family serine peptidase [Ardenticatenaceae bacterium]|nr:S8 family serine peptidase [Ardenticatenaceae bacterium]